MMLCGETGKPIGSSSSSGNLLGLGDRENASGSFYPEISLIIFFVITKVRFLNILACLKSPF